MIVRQEKKALPIYCVQTDKKQISISFDAAWGADDTIQILDVLDKHNVKDYIFYDGRLGINLS